MEKVTVIEGYLEGLLGKNEDSVIQHCIEDRQGTLRKPIDIKESQKVYTHSFGYSWGYNGSGCAQTALAILLYITEDKEISQKYYQLFKEEVISRLPIDKDWTLSAAFIQGWVEGKKSKEGDL